MGKIIVFTNVKGGVGKTVLSSLFASYLSQIGRPVAVVDADIQQSLSDHREEDLQKYPNSPLPWQMRNFAGMSSEDVSSTLANLRKISCDIVIDCPGNIIDPNLKAIYTAADIAVVPIHYDSDTIKATYKFTSLFKSKFGARMFFVPNNISGIEEGRGSVNELRVKAKDVLGCYGDLTPRIKRSVIVAEYSTILPLTYYQKNAVMYAFKPIIVELEKGGAKQ